MFYRGASDLGQVLTIEHSVWRCDWTAALLSLFMFLLHPVALQPLFRFFSTVCFVVSGEFSVSFLYNQKPRCPPSGYCDVVGNDPSFSLQKTLKNCFSKKIGFLCTLRLGWKPVERIQV
jgi:hypothetical protein